MGKFCFLIFLGLVSVLFWHWPKVHAADNDIVINEVMANPPAPETSLEWVELYNNSSDEVDLNGWGFENKVINDLAATIGAKNYLIIARNKTAFEGQWPGASAPIIQMTMVLASDADTVTLKNSDASYTETFSWTSDAGENLSWQRLSPTDNDWDISSTGGTPGAKNSFPAPPLPPVLPLAPTAVSPTNNQTIPFTDQVVFEWSTTEPQPQNFELIVSPNLDLSDPVINEPDLTNLEYEATNLTAGIYYWQVVASNDAGETDSEKYKFTLYNPVYSDAIIINELVPNPATDETKNEWIELYNTSDEVVDLTGWHLKDLAGSTHDFSILFDINGGHIIAPRGFAVFYRTKTGITLNNDTDGVALIQPDGHILGQTPLFAKSGSGWSWARTSAGHWSWTEKTTPLKANIIYLTPKTEKIIDNTEKKVVINKIPIEIKTGEFRNFDEKLVAVSGTVVSTSGNTFYLDDGSGQAKIYIQDKTGIDKPPMHKGDLFAIFGVVDLYRNTWRILPRKQSDVKLLQCIKDDQTETVTTTKKSSSTSTAKSTAGKSTAQARAPTPLIKQVKAAESVQESVPAKTTWWAQLAKAATGLAIVFLVILIIKLIRLPKVKVIGGRFGDDFT